MKARGAQANAVAPQPHLPEIRRQKGILSVRKLRTAVRTQGGVRREHVKVERYKKGRNWAVYFRAELLAVTVYKKGAVAVAKRLSGPAAKAKRRRPCPA